MLRRTCCTIINTLLCVNAQALVQPVEWASPNTGLWGNPLNWAPARVPGLSDDILLGHLTPYTVFTQGHYTASSLTLSNFNVRLDILGNSSITLAGDIYNDGLIRVNPKQTFEPAGIRIVEDATIFGSGSLRLHRSLPEVYAIEVDDGVVFMNAAGHTIEGSGYISGHLINEGQILSGDGNEELVFDESLINNMSVMSARSQSGLRFVDCDIEQGDNGVIEAAGPGSAIVFDRTTLVGGELRTSVGGVLKILGNTSYARDVHIVGELDIDFQNSSTRINFENSQFDNVALRIVSTSLDVTPVILRGGTAMTGAGSIRLEALSLSSSTVFIAADSSIDGSYFISGYGYLNGSFTNRIGILASDPGKELRLFSDIQSSSSIDVRNGARLTILGSITQLDGSSLRCAGEDSVLWLDGTIEGGSIVSTNGGKVMGDRRMDFVDMVLDADIESTGGIGLRGNIINNGTLTGWLIGWDDLVLEGSGMINLRGGINNVNNSTLLNFTNTVNQTIEGGGGIRANFTNYGIVRSISTPFGLDFKDGSVYNEGIIEAVDGAKLFVSVPFEQSEDGVLHVQGPGGELRVIMSAFENPSFIGGEVRSSGGAVVNIYAWTEFANLHLDAYTKVQRNGLMMVGEGVLLDGVIEIEESDPFHYTGSVRLLNGDLSDGACIFRLTDPEGDAAIFTIPDVERIDFGPGHRIEGIGRVLNIVRMSGTLAPGYPLGDFSLEYPFEFSETGRLEIEIAQNANDSISSPSQITLGGTLDIRFLDGFEPSSFWVRTVVNATELIGNFETIQSPPAPDGLVTRVYNTGTQLLVGQTCVADMNLDSVLNFFDVSEYLVLFGDEDPAADLNEDGRWNFFDVSLFLQAISAGCP